MRLRHAGSTILARGQTEPENLAGIIAAKAGLKRRLKRVHQVTGYRKWRLNSR